MRIWQHRAAVLPKHTAGWQAALSSGVSLPAEPCRCHLESKCLGVGMVLSLLWGGGRVAHRRGEVGWSTVGPTGPRFTKSYLGQIKEVASGLHSLQEKTGL